ncbi:MAG TPA: PCP reductase family protein, partial [Dongiaceae bacterium]|nr:PCP reductase family protein [Dongiaceae bacterium]
ALPPAPAAERRLIARDANKNPLLSPYAWTEEAVARVFRVPAGFMRNQTQERIEALTAERGVSNIDLALVEEGIEFGKQMMAAMIEGYKKPNAVAPAPTAGASGNSAAAPSTSTTPSTPPASRPSGLNEVGRMSVMAAARREE